MNREQFLHDLDSSLRGKIPDEELAEITGDYDEHFRMGILEKRNEDDIAAALGEPKEIAKEWRALALVKQAEDHSSLKNLGRAILATVGLGLFNIIVILIPAIIIIVILAILLFTGFGLAFFGPVLTIIAAGELAGLFNTGAFLIPGAGFFLGIGICALGLLTIIADVYITRWLYYLAIRYLRWNIAIIQGNEKI